MIKSVGLSLFTALLLISCGSKNALTGKKGLKLLPEAELQSMATTEYTQFLSANKVVASNANKDAEMVNRVGQRIIKAVESYYAEIGRTSDLAGYKWEVNLVDDKTVNAWCMPGGKIVVYTGLLPITQNEAALAAVMGHEVSHALLQHGNQRMSSALLQQMGGIALSAAVANKPQQTQGMFLGAYGAGTQVGVLLPFSRKHELEADHYGLIFTAMAGYNPQEAISLWERMKAASNGQTPPEFLSTHPAEDKRIEELKKHMPEALARYKPVGK